jgi:hypothetical protein
MSMAETVLITCDCLVKGRPCGQEADTYTVTRGDESWQIDLCDKHSLHIWEKFHAEGRVASAKGKRRTASTSRRPWNP